ncbi:HMG box family protein [Histomonas meleagridis]|uniref:HMG box family protein n=1 Tax=Histomonas meleagridis TaxID=135588 RepID=UPI00355A3D45|nr:HMG box family protein [Histomonas meleagridis]KAH0798691.1 HMG box family protein [Histomonas meleagridis]
MFANQGEVEQLGVWQPQQPSATVTSSAIDEADNSHRPPNAFILYSQAMRAEVRQNNPTLSNIEISKILGKMWKEVSNEVKLQYKQQAAKLQEEFKINHPNYTYRKARRKRALNELLTKNNSSYDPMLMMHMGMIQNPQMSLYPGLNGMQQMPGMVGIPQMAGIPQTLYSTMNPAYSLTQDAK